ncbi:hypothetical protein LZC95_37650 [Pendulispora brunnea]|uniref:N-acetyltransferase domain-containing protein n=1 Tax=Pendulispora brunnea TaxID=2905690 RepID=A0ABZ2K4M1_9BACT
MMYAPDTISRFLWSIGKRAEADFYLALFRAETKERFATIAVDGPVLTHALDALVVDLRFLSELGLVPIIVLGLLDADDVIKHASSLALELARVDVSSTVIEHPTPAEAAEAARVAARDGVIPILPLASPPSPASGGRPLADRFEMVRVFLDTIQTRKLIFLQRRGGILLDGRAVSLVELNADLLTLVTSKDVSRKQKTILNGIAYLIDRLTHRCTFAMTSPIELLRELFTTGGSGTMVRRAARVERYEGFGSLDTARLVTMLESAFERPLSEGFLERPVSRIYLEEHYRGAALVLETPLGAYMSKFAVGREAQGEGLGKDVWGALTQDYANVFWRSRTKNAINAWYTKQCDGMIRTGVWQVFWRGLSPERIPEAIAFALDQPKDFPRVEGESTSSLGG